MIPGDRSTLRCAAAEALVSVAERGDEAAKAALLERLKVDEDNDVRWETSCSTPFRKLLYPHQNLRKGSPSATQRSRSWWVSNPIRGMR
eukprot:1988233-Amphidinium_carterae.1